MNTKLIVVKCPKCSYEGNINCYGNDTYFKIYEHEYRTPYIKCPKCNYIEKIM